MFSGIVEVTGTIVHLATQGNCKCFVIKPDKILEDLAIGDSIAVNGVCLTITEFTQSTFSISAVPETRRLTTLDFLIVGKSVNLERSIKFGARVGGHYMQGHVEGIGEILQIINEGDAKLLTISVPSPIEKYLIKKGYIAIDGMSITVIDVGPNWITVTLVPHTQSVTIANNYKVGTPVNLETDMLAKHIEKLLGGNAHVIAN